MKRSLANRAWHAFLKFWARLYFVLVCQIRRHGHEHMPATGGALLLSNHQSHMDPVVVGLCCQRRLNYVARSTLFKFAPFRWLINSLDAIPIEREGSGFGGLKETLKRIKRGEIVLMFPEGTRTRDGNLQKLKPGFATIARRAAVPLVPVAIDGAYDAWPRTSQLPGRAVIHVQFGPAIMPEETGQMSDEQLVAEVERRIGECLESARRKRDVASGGINAHANGVASCGHAHEP